MSDFRYLSVGCSCITGITVAMFVCVQWSVGHVGLVNCTLWLVALVPPSHTHTHIHPHTHTQHGNTEVLLEDGTKSMFYYVQLLNSQLPKPERVKRLWDPTFALVYQDSCSFTGQGWSQSYVARHIGSDRLPKSQLIQYLQKKAKVRGRGYDPNVLLRSLLNFFSSSISLGVEACMARYYP